MVKGKRKAQKSKTYRKQIVFYLPIVIEFLTAPKTQCDDGHHLKHNGGVDPVLPEGTLLKGFLILFIKRLFLTVLFRHYFGFRKNKQYEARSVQKNSFNFFKFSLLLQTYTLYYVQQFTR